MRRKVFISSVMEDYEKYREAAKKAICDLHQEPIMAEDFPALSRSPRTACLDGVRESEIYIGLFGARFSKATTDEYEEARNSGRDLLIFVEKVSREDAQAEFLHQVEDYVSGHFRNSFSHPQELYEKVIKALSGIVFSEKTDFASADLRVTEFGKTLRKEQFESWLWLVLKTVLQGTPVKTSEFIHPAFSDRVLELALSKSIRLFDLRMASESRLKGERLTLSQKKLHRDSDMRTVFVQQDGLVASGAVITDDRDSRNPFASFYIDPEIVEERVSAFFRFADQLFQWLDAADRIKGISIACYLSGTDKHFEKPNPARQNGMTMPWVTRSFPDPIMVPKSPFNLRKEDLKLGADFSKEIVALIRQVFSER